MDKDAFLVDFVRTARALRERYQERLILKLVVPTWNRVSRIRELERKVRRGDISSEEARRKIQAIQLEVTNFEDPMLDLFDVLAKYEKELIK